MTPTKIHIEHLARDLNEAFPEILFAFLFGSSQEGIIKSGPDIDLEITYNIVSTKLDLFDQFVDEIRKA